MKEDKIGGPCSMHVGYEKLYKIFVGKLEGQRDHLEDLGIDGKEIVWENADWTYLAQEPAMALVNAVMHLLVP
jgi:hypothetical protein